MTVREVSGDEIVTVSVRVVYRDGRVAHAVVNRVESVRFELLGDTGARCDGQAVTITGGCNMLAFPDPKALASGRMPA